MEHETFLKTESIPKLMKRYCLPCIISLLVAALYNIVDQILSPMHPIWVQSAMPPTP